MVRIGMIGMGNMGCKYARILLDGGISDIEIKAITRIKPDSLKKLPEINERNIPIYETADKLFEAVESGELEIDAVFIVTPHSAHEHQAIRALELGLHVLCDKPAGTMSRQGRNMAEVARKNKDLIFGMIFNQRMNPIYQKMKEIVESKQYGAIKRINWTITDWYRPNAYYDTVKWRGTWKGDGGGVLLNQCPHNLDLLYWICGMPRSVQAFCKEGKYHHIEVEDEVTAYFEYDNGATGIFYATTGEAPGMNRFEISLEDALLVCDNGKLKLCELGFKESEYRKNATDHFAKLYGTWKDIECLEENTAHRGVIQNFINAIEGKDKLLIDGKEGIYSLLLSNAMYYASWERKMIDIPQTIEEYIKFEEAFEKLYSEKVI